VGKARLAVVACVALALLAAGCGGDKKTLSKDEFVQRSGEICTKANTKLEAAGREFFKSGSGAQPTEAEFVDEKVVPILQKDLLDPIEALGAPKGDEKQIDAVLAAGRDGLNRLQKNPESIKAPPGSAKDPLRRFGQLAKAYGLTCGG
jgi:hypothetical protein